MTKLIFIVYGTTGEYSDRSEWAVAAYADEGMARDHIDAATRWYQENDCYAKRYGDEFQNPFDPEMSTDYTGTSWFLGKTELRDALPTAETPMQKLGIAP